jgi:phosphoribosylglycinamide formyltransferase-1
VDELYDHGQVIFQASCMIEPADTPETLAKKIHWLEHEHFPRVIEELLTAPAGDHPPTPKPSVPH